MIGRTCTTVVASMAAAFAMRFNGAAAKHPDSGKDWSSYLARSMRTIFDSGVVNLNVVHRFATFPVGASAAFPVLVP
jgi:hypothetical protein